MKKIFWGLLLIYLHFNLNIGNSTIDLLPNFVGYLLIAGGMEEVAQSTVFTAARPMVFCTAFYAGTLWAIGLLDISLGWVGIILGAVSLSLQLIVTYRIVQGVKELESLCERDLHACALRNAWIAMAIGSAANYVFGIFSLERLSVFALVFSFVAAVYYIVKFYFSKKAYLADGGERL